MPKFHFPIVDGVRLEDPAGLELANEDQAKKQAESIARHIALTNRKTDRNVVVESDNGREINRVPVKRG